MKKKEIVDTVWSIGGGRVRVITKVPKLVRAHSYYKKKKILTDKKKVFFFLPKCSHKAKAKAKKKKGMMPKKLLEL